MFQITLIFVMMKLKQILIVLELETYYLNLLDERFVSENTVNV